VAAYLIINLPTMKKALKIKFNATTGKRLGKTLLITAQYYDTNLWSVLSAEIQ